MTALLKFIDKFRYKFDYFAEHFVLSHLCLSFAAILIGMPFFILASVAAFFFAMFFDFNG